MWTLLILTAYGREHRLIARLTVFKHEIMPEDKTTEAVEETTDSAEDQVEETNDETSQEEESKEQSEEESEEKEGVDYKAELDSIKQHNRTNAERRLKSKEKPEDEDEEETPEPVVDEEVLQKLVQRETRKIRADVSRNVAKQYANAVSRNKDEAELTMWHFENSINSTGDIEEDIENANLLANKKRFAQELSEVNRAMQSKSNRTKSIGAGQRIKEEIAPTLSREEEKLIKAFGVTSDDLKKGVRKQ